LPKGGWPAKKFGNYIQFSFGDYYPKIPVFQLLKNTAKRAPDRVFILHPKRLTFGEVDELSDRLATALASLGIKKGDTVGIFLWNSPEFVIAFYGILKTGATVTALNPSFKEKDAKHQLDDSEAVALIVDGELYPTIENIRRELPRLKHIIVTGEKKFPETYLFDELLKNYPPNPPKVEINPEEDIAALQYTAGTTGLPKGCMLTHYNLVSNALQVALFSAVAWGLHDEENVTLVHLPLYHSYGMTVCLNASALAGGQIVIQKRFDPVEWLELIQKYRVNAVATVMPVISFYVKNPDLLKKYDLSSLKFVNNGAVPIMLEVAKEFEKITGVTVTQGYGLSETSPVTNSNPKVHIKLESVGPPFPDTEEKIVDPDDPTKELPPGEIGELAIRGPQVMKGYWKRPEETAKALTPDGWLLTGDLAKMDEDGYVYIVERKKEIIKCMGFTIAPAELEAVLLEHPAVFDCAVVPKPDPEKVEVPKAYVALKPEYKASPELAEELLKWVNSKVAGYKKIHEVEFVASIPRSLAGKVLRREFIEREKKKVSG